MKYFSLAILFWERARRERLTRLSAGFNGVTYCKNENECVWVKKIPNKRIFCYAKLLSSWILPMYTFVITLSIKKFIYVSIQM